MRHISIVGKGRAPHLYLKKKQVSTILTAGRRKRPFSLAWGKGRRVATSPGKRIALPRSWGKIFSMSAAGERDEWEKVFTGENGLIW